MNGTLKLDLKTDDLILNHSYSYSTIVYMESKFGLNFNEYGEELIGEHFIVLKNDSDSIVYSFVMDGYSTEGMYRLIYKFG